MNADERLLGLVTGHLLLQDPVEQVSMYSSEYIGLKNQTRHTLCSEYSTVQLPYQCRRTIDPIAWDENPRCLRKESFLSRVHRACTLAEQTWK